MTLRHLTVLLGLSAAALGVHAEERERNAWPLFAGRSDGSHTAGGPLFFSQPAPDGGTTSGFRPFWVQTTDARGDFRSGAFLYPLFSYKADDEYYSWSLFQLINRTGRRASAGAPESLLGSQETFAIWPFWFSRITGEQESQYRALFPVAGTVRGKLGFERLSWTLFPFYVESEKHGAVTTSTPWPLVRVTRGTAQGFALWPLYSTLERPGVSRDRYWLWPFAYESVRLPTPDDPPGTGPTRRFGVLPFYAQASGPGYFGEDFLWPFFGHTERTAPLSYAYRENRWFWPLFVQGRGADHYVNRWAPFYTHSVVKGYDKTWVAWPLWREAKWEGDGVAQTKSQLLWFVYWSQEQRSLANPNAAPASLTHLWPLFSAWDNGAGKKQVQFLSPLSVFFPQLDHVRNAWSPLFAVFRYDQRAPGDARMSLLWDGVTWDRRAADRTTEFHLGPIMSVTNQPQEQRVTLANGLIGMKRAPGERAWRLFWLDFPAKHAKAISERP